MQSVRLTATRGIAVLALAGLVVAGCSSSTKSSTKTTSPPSTLGSTPATSSNSGASNGAATGTPIKIGFVTSVTGNASSTFNNSDIGAKAYFDAINKQGGFNGHPLQLITKDDAST